MEHFYDDLAEVLKKEGVIAFCEATAAQEEVDNPDLLVFDQGMEFEKHDNQGEELLQGMLKEGYEILLNFQAADVILGNVVVKLEDRWFAFGQCRNDPHAGPYVTDIWPLKYVLMRLPKTETGLISIFQIESAC
jgi:hypothetical protein